MAVTTKVYCSSLRPKIALGPSRNLFPRRPVLRSKVHTNPVKTLSITAVQSPKPIQAATQDDDRLIVCENVKDQDIMEDVEKYPYNKPQIARNVEAHKDAFKGSRSITGSSVELIDARGEMERKSKVLIIGSTGGLGYHLAQLSLKCSHRTNLLVRDSAYTDPIKRQKLQSLSEAGATILKGSLEDEKSLSEAVKPVDVVICSIPSKQVLDQSLLIRVIKEAGCVKRFLPSEFGADPDKIQISDMDYKFYSRKAEIRRLVEAEGIPYTYISCNFLMSNLLPSLDQSGSKAPLGDKVMVFGDGNVKAVSVKEEDVAAFTICAIDDPRTLNKVMYLRPPGNVYSMNELVEILESKIGKKLEKIHVREDELLTKINESSGGVEGTHLYPQLEYTTISKYLDTLLKEYSSVVRTASFVSCSQINLGTDGNANKKHLLCGI